MKKRFLTFILTIMAMLMCVFGLSACNTVEFKVNFVVDGEVYSAINTNGEEVIKMPENPTKEGYTFDGWFWDKDVWSKPFTANSLLDAPISSDMSVYAKFNAFEYDITYNVDGGTHSNPLSYTIEDSITLSDTEKTGYSFRGWYSDSNYNTKVEAISAGTTGDITLYAKFEIENYTITYTNTKDVDNDNPTSYNVNSDTILLTNLSKNGYTFDGWYNGEEKVTEIAKGSTGNLTLEAKWTAIEYEVIYHNVNGATNNNPENYNVEEQPLVLAVLEKAGYNFLGWFTDENFTNEITEISVGTTGEINLYAKWEIIEYTATFMDGTTFVEEIKFTVETESIDEPAVPNHVGYNGEWEDYILGTEDIIIDAVYTTIEYTATFMDGNTVVKEVKFTVETESIEEPAVPNHVGYTGDWEYYELALEDITIDAVYTAIEYTATFMDGTTVVEEVKFTVETESIDEPTVPAHVGYNGEWEDYTLGTEDIIIKAVYTIVTYNIEYLNTKDLESENPETYTIESETIVLKNLSKQGYTFEGWYNNAGNKVEEIKKGSYGNVKLTARWTALTYTITYLYDNAYGDVEEGKTLKTSYTVEDEFAFEELVCKNEGFNFRGWFTQKNVGTGNKVLGVAKGTTGNFTVYAQFGLEVYDITYINVNGAINNNPTYYDTETEDFTIYPLSKEGYNFDGWFANEECTEEVNLTIVKGSKGDITLYAKWTAITYTIEYVTYGGGFENNTYPKSYTINDEISLVEPTLSNNFFVGWFTLAENGKLQEEIEKGSTGNVTLYARWISFESNGGSKVEYEVSIEKDRYNQPVKINQPVAPEKDYYTLEGWYTDEELTSKFNFAIPSKNLVLYANWEATEYKINYVLNGGENAEENQETYNVEEHVILADASKTGYTFVGWFTDEDFTSTVVKELPLGSHGEITLYAHYSINKYTISFETNGGTSVTAITQNYATDVTAPESPAKNGYEFVGWYSNEALTRKYTFSTMPAENIMLYAKWNIVTYDIVYNLDGGRFNTNNYPKTYRIDSNDISLVSPIKNGYTFDGWYTDENCTEIITEITKGSYGDLELFAKWTVITYTIEYVMPDGTINNNATTYTIETDLTTLTNASVKGYDFIGWFANEDFTTAITTIGGGETSDKTIYGKFNPATYNVWLDGNEEAKCVVSFNLNGADGSIANQTITPTATLKYPGNPTREGYIFAGWYDNETCEGSIFDFTAIVTSDTTLYAKWVKIENATAIAINGSANITLDGKTEQMLTFVPLVSGNITIISSGSYDTFGVLYNADMVALMQDDDTASDGLNFHIVYNVTAGKTYYIGARAFSSTTTGSATVSISGNTTVLDGGYTITASKDTVIYGSNFTLKLPEAREGYKFLGYADENGVMYTDSTGASVKTWDKDQDTTLYSVWEKMVYTVTFETSGGSPIESIELAFGERLDIGQYVTTRTNYSFDCWYLGDDVFEATTMPDHDITLEASWKRYSIGTIKCDDSKTAISYKDVITAELFGVYAIDTDGKFVDFTITVNNVAVSDYTLTAGETISVKFVAGTRQKTITAKVYGMPTLNYTTTDYVNIPNGLTASAFSANGLDTFGNATTIRVSIIGEYKAGDTVSVLIEFIDVAGNITTATVENVKVYGAPVIKYNEDKTAIKVSDTIDATLFGATATDSFGKPLTVTVNKYSGTQSAGNTITVKFTTTDSKGNTTTFTVSGIKVYGIPTISNAMKTEFKEDVSDIISPETLGLTAKDTFNNSLDIRLTLKSGSRIAGSIMVYTASVTDIAGNSTTKDITVKIYGTPTITVERTDIKISENPVNTPSVLKATAKDSFNNSLSVKVTLKSGTVAGGDEVVYTISTTDKLGNVATLNKNVKIYDVNDIDFTYSKRASDVIKVDSKGEEFFAEATDSFGEDCVITIEPASGYTLTAGKTVSFYIVATDKVGNVVKSDLIEGIEVYGTPIVNTTSDFLYEDTDLNTFITVTDSFGEELVAEIAYSGEQVVNGDITFSIKAQDELGNVLDAKLTLLVCAKWFSAERQGEDIVLIKYVGTDTEVIVPNAITKISSTAFVNNTAIQKVVVPNNVIEIEKGAFSGCSNLRELTLPFVGAKLGVNASDTHQYPFGYIFGTNSYDDCVKTEQFYYGSSASSTMYSTYYIPSTLKSVTVTGGNILRGAFYNCSSLTNVTIPNSVTSMGNFAFYNCSSLTRIEIPNSVTSIGGSAFSGCTSLTSITIPNSVTSIGSSTFYNCSSLTNVTIPNSVTSIGSSAFRGCSSLTEITLPFVGAVAGKTSSDTYQYPFGYIFGTNSYDDCVKTEQFYYGSSASSTMYSTYYIPSTLKSVTVTGGNILFGAFYNCSMLENIVLPNSVTSIGSSAFRGCSSLTRIEIPNSVTSIGGSAFSGCTSLTSITILNSVTSIGGSAFSGCTSLTSITIPNSVTSIGSSTFYNCSSLTSIEIPNSVTSIGERAFYECTSLTSIEIPNSVTSIGDYAFYSCNSLTSVVIGDSVTSIGSEAFSYCGKLTSVEIPNNVTSIGDGAFAGCSKLTSVTIGNGVTDIGSSAFYGCGLLTEIKYNAIECADLSYDDNIFNYAGQNGEGITVTIGNLVKKIPAYLFQPYYSSNFPKITTVIFEKDSACKSIGKHAFYECSKLTSIEIPNSVIDIGHATFYRCTSLKSISLPFVGESLNGTTNTHFGYIFGASNYSYNSDYVPTSLKKVTITSATSIGAFAFAYCSSLTNIEIPDIVTIIGKNAFYNCSSLTYNVKDELKYLGNTNNPYFYLASAVSQDITTANIDNKCNLIGSSAFYNCESLTSVTIGENVEGIGSNAFYNCYYITKVNYMGTIDEWVQIEFGDVYANPIYYAKKLYINNISVTEANITTATKISDYALYNCRLLTSVTIGNSVQSIGNEAFYNCSSLTSIGIPNSVTSIGNSAFYNCTSLTSIEIPNSVTSIGENAFNNCYNMTKVNYLGAIDEWVQIEFNSYFSNPLYYAENLYINDVLITEANITTAYIVNAYSFYNCSSLTSVVIFDSVTSIGEDAFRYCSSLTSITLPFIGGSVTANQGYDQVFGYIFGYTVSTSDRSIRSAIYQYCDNSSSSSNNYYHYYIPTSLKKVTITSTLSIGDRAFYNCSSLTSIEMPDSVTNIGDYAFYNCSSLESVQIPNSVTSIGGGAFYYCYSLTSVVIPNSVTSIGNYAFYNCTSLESIEIPNNVTNIGSSAFYNCSSLTNVTIPNSVTSIGDRAFYNCSSLTSVTFSDTSTWYVTTNSSDWNNKIGGAPTDVTSVSTNATYLKSTYYYYYWYKK